MRSFAHEASSACKDAARAEPEHLPEEEADAEASVKLTTPTKSPATCRKHYLPNNVLVLGQQLLGRWLSLYVATVLAWIVS